jgi:hypothetical protein
VDGAASGSFREDSLRQGWFLWVSLSKAPWVVSVVIEG